MLSFQQQSNAAQAMQQHTATQQQAQQQAQDQQNIQNTIHHLQQQQQGQQQGQPSLQSTMRLRDDPPLITPPARATRKRKSPSSAAVDQQQSQQQQQQPQPPAQPQMQHVLPPPHALMHPPHGLPGPLPPGFAYTPVDYTPGGLPPGMTPQPPPQPGQQQQQQPRAGSAPSSGRTLSNSKRAEQNRKAQRAFRERRDQHVKYLESRSQLLDAALQSADEANRRWEECRGLVDQLRVENAALRAALSHAGLLPGGANPPAPPNSLTMAEANNKDNSPEQKRDGSSSAAVEQKND